MNRNIMQKSEMLQKIEKLSKLNRNLIRDGNKMNKTQVKRLENYQELVDDRVDTIVCILLSTIQLSHFFHVQELDHMRTMICQILQSGFDLKRDMCQDVVDQILEIDDICAIFFTMIEKRE